MEGAVSLDRRIIEQAQSALRDLYGLVPEKDRRYADDHLKVLERVLRSYSQNIDHMRQVEAAMHHADLEIHRTVKENLEP
jgi:hypothetical protein